MGLDAVEIVMAIEEAFDIQIEDSEAEYLFTPRDVINLVALKTSRLQTTECLTQRAFNRLRAGFIRHGGQKREEIRPKAKIGQLISRSRRRQIIRQILDEIGVTTDPHFVRPRWLIASICIGSFALAIASTLVFVHWGVVMELIPIVGFAAMVGAWFCLWLTKGMRYELDPSVATVGDLSRWVVARGPSFIAIEPCKWTREQIAERVREVVIGQLGCAKNYREDVRFIEDLGLG